MCLKKQYQNGVVRTKGKKWNQNVDEWFWITNGIESKHHFKNNLIPDGWRKGRILNISEEGIRNISKANTGNKYHKGMKNSTEARQKMSMSAFARHKKV